MAVWPHPAVRILCSIPPEHSPTSSTPAGVSVVAATAMLPAPEERRQAILQEAGGLRAIYVTPQGGVSSLESQAHG